MNPEQFNPEGLAVVLAFAFVVCVVALFSLARRRIVAQSDDLPPDLLDDLIVNPAGEWLELRGRLVGGKRISMKVDRRHAHVLSDELLRATMKHYGAKLHEKGNGDGRSPPLSS